MSATRIVEVIEAVQADSRFRVSKTARGWRILPPDRTVPPIFVMAHTINSGCDIENTKARLRRAGFEFPGDNRNNRPKETPMPEPTSRTLSRIGATPPAVPTAPEGAPTQDAYAKATECIHRAIEALSELEGHLQTIQTEGQAMQELKTQLQRTLGFGGGR